MNMQIIDDTLNQEGISHRLIDKHTYRFDWIVDGAARPVIVFDAKTNRETIMKDFHEVSKKSQSYLNSIVKRCKFQNLH